MSALTVIQILLALSFCATLIGLIGIIGEDNLTPRYVVPLLLGIFGLLITLGSWTQLEPKGINCPCAVERTKK